MDGQQIVKDLINYRSLWTSVMSGRFYHQDLIHLRDMDMDVWNVDSLAIYSSNRDNRKLEEIVDSWRPDSIDWIGIEDATDLLGMDVDKEQLLFVWWDQRIRVIDPVRRILSPLKVVALALKTQTPSAEARPSLPVPSHLKSVLKDS